MKRKIMLLVALIFWNTNAVITVKARDVKGKEYTASLEHQEYHALVRSPNFEELRVCIAERFVIDNEYNSLDSSSEGLDESLDSSSEGLDECVLRIIHGTENQFPLEVPDGERLEVSIVKSRDFEVTAHEEFPGLQTITFHTPDGKKCGIDVENMFEILPDAFSTQYCPKLFNELNLREAPVVNYFRLGKTRLNTYHHYKPLLTAELLLFLRQNASEFDGKLRRLKYTPVHSGTDLPEASYAMMLLLSRKGFPIYSYRNAGNFLERDYEGALRNLPDWSDMSDEIIDIVNLLGGYRPARIVTRSEYSSDSD